MRTSSLLLAALVLPLVSCGGRGDDDGPPPPVGVDAREAVGSGGMYRVRWVPDPDPVPLNEPFALELELAPAGDEPRPVEGLSLFVSGWMPDHLHGMNVVPLVEELGGGRYRADGVVLHMPGHWQLFVDVVADGLSERAEFAQDL